MKRSVFFSLALLAGWGVAAASPVSQVGTAKVKSVKVYPEGVYMTLSMPVSLHAGTDQKFTFPDLWYADPETVEVRLIPESSGDSIGMVTETSSAVRVEDIRAYKDVCRQIDSIRTEVEKLKADSMVLQREIDFLQANARQESGSVGRLSEMAGWMQKRYAELYEGQRRTNRKIGNNNEELVGLQRVAENLERQYEHVTLVSVRIVSHKTCGADLELSYYANAARWEPFYFFRFSPGLGVAELEYQATLRQWTGFDWEQVSAELCYGSPARTIRLPVRYTRTVSYHPPVPVVRKSKQNAMFEAEVKPDRKLGYATNVRSIPSATETDVSYRLMQPLTLANTATYEDKDSRQMIQVRKDTVQAVYDYVVKPYEKVFLAAHIPDWQQLYLADGRMTVFCDGRMLGQTDLSVNSVLDTLSIPLTVEPRVVVNRIETRNYKEQISRKKEERTRSYEIKIKNNKEFPVSLTVKDQYPVSNTDEVEVTLTESSGAQVDRNTGMLTWKLELAPGAERILRFGYAVRYPKGGTVYF